MLKIFGLLLNLIVYRKKNMKTNTKDQNSRVHPGDLRGDEEQFLNPSDPKLSF
jgi:hypothetical protein